MTALIGAKYNFFGTFTFNRNTKGTYKVVANLTNTSEVFDTTSWNIRVSTTPVTTYSGTIKSVNESNVHAFSGLTVYNTDARIDFGNATKVITRYMQYTTVDKIVNRVLDNLSGNTDKKKGLIWHWQGSGKTLEMIFAG